jgi:septal ring factor EnvC (AmiA/AmiB activator)
MLRRMFASGLLLVVGFGLLLAGRVSSQDKGDVDNRKGAVAFSSDAPQANLDQLVRELKGVRAQRAELDRREQQLMEAIEMRINAERQQLAQKVQERQAQLEEIERLIHGNARGKYMRAGSKKEEFKRAEPKREEVK